MRRKRITWAVLDLVSLLAACGGGAPEGGDMGRRTEDAGVTGDAGSDGCPTACDDGVFCNGVERCEAGACIAGEPPACNDGSGCTVDRCSEDERACVFEPADSDGDEHGAIECGGDDCDDGDALRYPGAEEICDAPGVDEDCDPTTFGVRDADDDGYPDGRCCNGELCGGDCDDTSSSVHPTEAETCDGRDNDCDGSTDEEVMVTYYRDADGDGYAADAEGTESITTCMPPIGFVTTRGDCNDGEGGINPAAYDSCDMTMLDENCDGTPNNPPMGCACTIGESRACMAPGRCAGGREICVAGAWGACSVSPSTEVCNGEDDDCNGTIDDGLRITCYTDADADGYAAGGARGSEECACPAGTTRRAPMGGDIDCDDANPTRSPGIAEVCDRIDQDCDGVADDGLPTATLYEDRDGDGRFGTAVVACIGRPGTSSTSTDCHDSNRNVFAGQTAFFERPYCRGYVACHNGIGWGCYDAISTTGACWLTGPGPRPRPSWDYDCSGVDERSPDRSPTCGTAPSCASACLGEGGYDYDPATPPSCGAPVSSSTSTRRWSCGCSLARCRTNIEEGYFACR